MNGGGIRGDRVVPPGPLTRRDVVAMLPFANVIVSVEVTGRAAAHRARAGRWPGGSARAAASCRSRG